MNWKELIGVKNFDELVTDARLKLGVMDSKITSWSIGGVLRTLIELSCYGLASLNDLLVRIVPQGFVRFATGKWLDLWADSVGIVRREAEKAAGVIDFYRDEIGTVVRIPAGSIVKTETTASGQELRFFTETEVILGVAELRIKVPVRAEFEGALWNVGAGYVRTLVTHIAGIDGVVNAVDWLTHEGIDRETDESLRNRYYLKWEELSTGSTAGAYESWAYHVQGVEDVEIDDMHPRGDGTVDVIVAGPNGAPSQALIDQVTDYIDTRRPMCSDVLVTGPTPKILNLEIKIFLHPQHGNEEIIRQQVEAVLQDFFIKRVDSEIEAQRISQDFVKARLIRYLMLIEWVVNVKVLAPLDDVIIGKAELATRGDIRISFERVTAT